MTKIINDVNDDDDNDYKDNNDDECDGDDINDDTIGLSYREDVSDIWPQIVTTRPKQRAALATRLKNTSMFDQPTQPERPPG